MKILVVDDSPIDRRLASALLSKAGFETSTAKDGGEALGLIDANPVDLVLTDLQMPGMDGLELVEAVRKRHAGIPVILMTAHGSEDLAFRALQRGAASYVPKRDLAKALVETVRSVLSVVPAKGRRPSHPDFETRWELGNDPSEISPVLADLELRAFDENARIQISVALREALVNAMLHGNLELASSLKELDPAEHDRLAESRRGQAPYSGRRVRVSVAEASGAVRWTITDDGAGFDLASIPDPTDLANLERTTGRGLFLMRTIMDDVQHADGGRTVVMVKRTSS